MTARTGRPTRLRIELGVVRLETDIGPGDGTFSYTLRADDGSYEETQSASGSDATTGPVTLTFAQVPMDQQYTLEIAPPEGDETQVAFESVPFRALQL
ncbi:MAG: hypothetical protein R3B40_29370 [Polyangiales bacterium]|nr:hypothetical protein [Myxococcales bacterium]